MKINLRASTTRLHHRFAHSCCGSGLGSNRAGNSNLSPRACRRQARPLNWLHRRFYRTVWSGPLETTGGAPDGRKGTKQKVAGQTGRRNSSERCSLLARTPRPSPALPFSFPALHPGPLAMLPLLGGAFEQQSSRAQDPLTGSCFRMRANKRRALNASPVTPTWYSASASFRITATSARFAWSASRAFLA